MRISTVTVKNFRSLKNVTLDFTPYTCLVGANGSGKSAIIKALNLFFHQNPEGQGSGVEITAEDFHQRDTSKPIRVEIVFDSLSDDAKDDLSHYVRDEKLHVVTEVTYDEANERGKPLQHGIRPGIEDFREFFIAVKERKPVAQLRNMFAELREKHTEVVAETTKDRMISALRSYESERPKLCTPMQSEDQFYGFTRGQNLLSKHIQWIYIPAVKDASSEESESGKTALASLVQRTVRASANFTESVQQLRSHTRAQFQTMLEEQQPTLEGLSRRLGKRMTEWAHPEASLEVRWEEDPNRSVRIDEPFAAIIAKEGSFEGHIGQFGHGLQRSFLLALLQELASQDDTGPTLVLACEEPELYQHPPQAKHLASVLQSLACQGDQIIVTTHAPDFVAPDKPEAVRLCRITRSTSTTTVAHTSVAAIAKAYASAVGKPLESPEGARAKIFASLQSSISEIFFARRVILVEGYEDVSFIETYMSLLDCKETFRGLGCHIVPCHGKNYMIRPLVVCKQLGIPVIVVFDTDADKPDKNGSRAMHKRDNLAILRLCGADAHDPLPRHDIWGDSVVGWHSDIGGVVRCEMGLDQWDEIKDDCQASFGSVGGLKKNPMFVAEMTAQAWDKGLRSSSLEKLCRLITEAK